MMTREQMIEAMDALTPAQQRIVLAAAQVIRTAREAGDTRPAAVIVAGMGGKPVLH